VLHPGLIRLILLDIFRHLDERDKPYFRESREERFGTTLEAACADHEGKLASFRQSLAPLRATLQGQPYLGGAAPNYADYLVFGAFQWPRMVSRFALIAEDDPIAGWFERCLDLFDGLGRRALPGN